jgi:adenylate cyclase
MTATRTILLVDDEPSVLSALRRTLRPDGHRVLTAGSAAEALEHLAVERIDLLIADIDMPVMGGLELLRQVRATAPATARVILSGRGSLETALRAINEGEVLRYLTKPWDNAALRATVEEVLARQAERVEAGESQAAALLRKLLQELEPSQPGVSEAPSDSVYVVDHDLLERGRDLLPAEIAALAR